MQSKRWNEKADTKRVTNGDRNSKESADSNNKIRKANVYVSLTVHPCITGT